MNKLEIFENHEFGKIRTVGIDGEPWFVGKDVAGILGYSDLNKAISMHVDEEDKKLNDKTSSSFGQRGATLINESGLYSLILSSKLHTAKNFKRWITTKVIPAIRKHGGYLTDEKIEEVLSDPDTIIKLATSLKEERAKRAAAEKQLEDAKPKCIFADAVATAKTSILIGDLAKLIKQNGYDIGQKRLFAWLRENGYLIKNGSSKNSPTQRAMDMALFEIKETTVVLPNESTKITKTTKVTGKGQIYFVNLFKKAGGLVGL